MKEKSKLIIFILCLIFMIINKYNFINNIGWILLILFIFTSKIKYNRYENKLEFEWGIINWIKRIKNKEKNDGNI